MRANDRKTGRSKSGRETRLGKKNRKREKAKSKAKGKKKRSRPGLFFHDLFFTHVERRLDPGPRVADMVVKQLEAQGAKVTPSQRRQIEEHVRAGREDPLKLKSSKWWKNEGPLTAKLTEEDVQGIEDDAEKLVARLPKIAHDVLEELAPRVLAGFRAGYLAEIRSDEKQFRGIATDIAKVWRAPFESLALLIDLVARVSTTVDAYYADKKIEEPYLVEAIARLHLRGIHIAREITVLLRSGYADGAMARWRTLHEVAVVVCFLAEHGEPCAKRYLGHEAVERYRAAGRYQEFANRLGLTPLTSEELTAVRDARDAAVREHGDPFNEEYGWAVTFVGNQLRPSFADLERAVGLDHLRPFYKLASDNVHAGVRGVLLKLGAVEEGKLLTTPSPAGLTDPGHSTALTLAVLAAHVTRICPAVDVLLCARMVSLLASEVGERFVAVDDSIEIVPIGAN
jgi:hypothetical protein